MVKQYFFPPDFGTAPPPEGPIHLGSILYSISAFDPLNRTVNPIPETELHPINKKAKFVVSVSDLHSADFGVMARALELFGVGANASITQTRGSNRVLSCEQMETITFNPTKSYMSEAMKDPAVLSFMNSSRLRVPVYMVTGLKVAQGASSTSGTSQSAAVEANTGLALGTPVEVGLKGGYARNAEAEESWVSLGDIIVAFRVTKMWLNRHGEAQSEPYTKKAQMLSTTSSSPEPEYTLHWDEDLTIEEINDMFGVGEDDI
ncbi:hypothetical protein CEP54_010306 [Fusarium duplospermum]|uniref:Uncharacterized protein n=1 Tax=Fusarium duplospermum TaxID=1325734 RepID=A0A428PKM3_9HYPO|nr:hypothetical protein CEP54_010306 [Fusarium duplospermum]